MSYRCHACQQEHDDPPMSFHAEAPESYARVPEAEREARCDLATDQCVIDDEHCFVRGLIEIPVIGLEEPLVWGVWVSLSLRNFGRAHELWNTEGREAEPPCFGWLNTELAPLYPSTLSLATNVHTRPVGVRPLVEVQASDHPLAVEQQRGISRDRLHEIWSTLLHD